MSQPIPAASLRLMARLTHLPPDGSRALDGALDRAEVRAKHRRRSVWVAVHFEVGPEGIEAIEVSERYEQRGVESDKGAT